MLSLYNINIYVYLFCYPNRSLGIPHQLYMFGTVRRFCDGMPDLNMEQKALCEENRDVMASIRYGATLAVKQCQYQFQYRRWNCSLPEQDRYTLFRRITGKGGNLASFTRISLFFCTYAIVINTCLFSSRFPKQISLQNS